MHSFLTQYCTLCRIFEIVRIARTAEADAEINAAVGTHNARIIIKSEIEIVATDRLHYLIWNFFFVNLFFSLHQFSAGFGVKRNFFLLAIEKMDFVMLRFYIPC